MSHKVFKLDPLEFPEDSPFKREPFFAPEAQFEDFEEKYDARTLFYQAILEEGRIRLLAPKLLNFEELINRAEFTSGRVDLSVVEIKNYRRHSEILLDAPRHADELNVKIDNFEATVQVMPRYDGLKGRNILVTRQKNNLLEWVRVWAEHHVAHQGVKGIVIVDNGSTDYTPQDLSDCLANVPSLKASVVIDAPFRFGPIAKDRPRNRGLFYQAAMLNLVKQGFAYNAQAAALCVDIDELITSENDETIFEETLRSRMGYRQIPGHWRYAKTASEPHILHSDHKWKSESRDFSKEKYCVKVNGRMWDYPWDIHNVGRGRFNKLYYSKSKSFYHCEQLSTSWIVNRAEPTVSDLKEDFEAGVFYKNKIHPIEKA